MINQKYKEVPTIYKINIIMTFFSIFCSLKLLQPMETKKIILFRKEEVSAIQIFKIMKKEHLKNTKMKPKTT